MSYRVSFVGVGNVISIRHGKDFERSRTWVDGCLKRKRMLTQLKGEWPKVSAGFCFTNVEKLYNLQD